MSNEKNIEENKPENPEDIIPHPGFPEDSGAPQPAIPNIHHSTKEDMEVHHHPKIEKKNFKEYLLEGFMIFIAVTLGFIAENLRESITERRQLHEHIESLVSDLQSDLAMYDSSIVFNLGHCRMIDTIITSLSNRTNNIRRIYYLARQLTMGSSVVSPNTKTFEQMKSGNGLRLVRWQWVADSIASYYQWTKKFDYWSTLQMERINNIIANNDKLFNGSAFFSILKKLQDKTSGPDSLKEDNLAFTSSDPALINSVIMCHQYYYGMLTLMNQRAALASQQASHLIALLKKEYAIEDEK
jgi:hypothetical protein